MVIIHCCYNEMPSYNIARVPAIYKSYWTAMNKIFFYARACVNTWAFFLPGFRVSVLLSCSAFFPLFQIWKKPAKNCPIFLSALTFKVLIHQATKIKPKKTRKLHVSQICRQTSCNKFWPKRHSLGTKRVINWSLTTLDGKMFSTWGIKCTVVNWEFTKTKRIKGFFAQILVVALWHSKN